VQEQRLELVPFDERLPELRFADEAQAMRWYQAERDNLVAAEYHRRAEAAYRDLGQRWETARTLAHLADALDRAGAPQEAADTRADACELLTAFTDPRAVRLRENIVAR
jgi:hypothetical protein